MTDTELKEIEARANAAIPHGTKGPLGAVLEDHRELCNSVRTLQDAVAMYIEFTDNLLDVIKEHAPEDYATIIDWMKEAAYNATFFGGPLPAWPIRRDDA